MAKNTIPAVEKALQMIELLGKSAEPLSRNELSALLQISGTSCYRLLQTLLAADYIRKVPGNRFAPGRGLLSAVRRLDGESSRYYRLQPLLDALARECGFGCKLSLRTGSEQVTVMRGEPLSGLHVSGKIGGRFPLIEGSVGAVLLGECTLPELQEQIAACQENIPEKSDPQLLYDRVAHCRKHGFVECESLRWHVHALSVPVYECGQIGAALTMLGVSGDFTAGESGSMVALLQKYAGEFSRQLVLEQF
ncbi:MAG: helix-turn-helix domain-containing protein [Lentisphaeria bacterium]|nr:helix-turn-helix domain-containing protein [Lentisphaeria bacterium]